MTQLVARCGKELTAALALLRQAGDVAPHTDAIRALVQDGDDVARAGLGELFSEEPSPIELVRWKDLYERLQATLTAARRAAATLDMIAVKQH